jgi:hypothetical protein
MTADWLFWVAVVLTFLAGWLLRGVWIYFVWHVAFRWKMVRVNRWPGWSLERHVDVWVADTDDVEDHRHG